MIYHVDTWEHAFELAKEKDVKIQVRVEEPCVLCCAEDKGYAKRLHAVYPSLGTTREPVAVPLTIAAECAS